MSKYVGKHTGPNCNQRSAIYILFVYTYTPPSCPLIMNITQQRTSNNFTFCKGVWARSRLFPVRYAEPSNSFFVSVQLFLFVVELYCINYESRAARNIQINATMQHISAVRGLRVAAVFAAAYIYKCSCSL